MNNEPPICPITNKKLENSFRFYGCRCDVCKSYWKNPYYKEIGRIKAKIWRKRPRNRIKRESTMRSWRYGITLEQYNYLRAKQIFRCAICDRPETQTRRLDIDHCHKTNKIRGLLCNLCNQGLGLFKDSISSLISAVKYLETTEHKE